MLVISVYAGDFTRARACVLCMPISHSFKMAERVMPVNVYQFLHELLRTLSTGSTSKLANVPAQMQLCQV